MPIYEYIRPDGTTFEVQQSFSEAPLTTDPDTGVPVKRVLHAPAVHFKGKGFYNTDYGTRKRQRELAAAKGRAGDSPSGDSSAKGSGEDSSGSSAPASEGNGKTERPSQDSPKPKAAKPLAAKS
jgi:putative FmdB family regulatory protein